MPESGTDDGNPSDIDICVCVPARNEAARLPVLFAALAAQTCRGPVLLAVAVNNSNDDSFAVIEQARVRYAGQLVIHVEQVTFAPEMAHAGSARRLAMDTGLGLTPASERGVLVSTDADTRPPPEWLDNIASAIARGADIVGGRIEIEPGEPLPEGVLRLRSAWDRYWEAVRAIEDTEDPLPWDEAPRHGDHTGASLAIRTVLYQQCGGVPLLRTGEDRALVNAALVQGGRLSHPTNVFTRVSPRRDGRAETGMAAAMQEMFDLAAAGTSPRAPALHHWQKRAAWRRTLRALPGGQAMIAQQEPLLAPMPHDMVLEIGT
ncbi:glycosyl transferase family 2 [Novosphingobium barchaimii LL02]|uniref:Glycosyl transferase family 2 n=1 Tax=Novosphingobium barchaimii LL02 TaxID=1114963 RepID=A0A0J7XY35_9SPHN|nr:glycosyltransferase family A protein [Novosphingobium barchaimii]KMS56571.1 glycosyl transferase family 2 [Novosphingobium barchaimii LL02]